MKVHQLHNDRRPRGEHHADAPRARDAQAGQGQRVEDAQPGREFQGIGVLNKARRFGSSTSAEQLGGSPDAAGGDAEDAGREAQGTGQPDKPGKA